MVETLEIPIELHPHQFDAVTAAEPFVGMITGLGGGKTFTGARWLILRAVEFPRSIHLATGNSYTQIRDVIIPEIRAALEEMGIDAEFRRSEYRFELDIGGKRPATILCRTTDTAAVDKIRGIEVGSWWADEARDMTSGAFDVVFGRLRCKHVDQVRMLVTSTPNGFDHLHRRFVERPQNDPELAKRWRLIQAASDANTDLPDGYLDEILGSYDPRMAQQERGGEFIALGTGRVYDPFNRAAHTGQTTYDPARRLILAADFNTGYFGWCICQPHPRQGVGDDGRIVQDVEVHVIDEVCPRVATVEQAAKALLESRYGKTHRGGWTVYPDAAGVTQGNRQTGQTDVQALQVALRELTGGERFDFRQPRANPRVRDRVTAVNAMLASAKGDSRMVIAPHCTELIADLEQLQWSKGDIDKSQAERSHVSDALGYYIHAEHKPQAFTRDRAWRARRHAGAMA